MGNSFKELNSLHLKRPAVVLIKKPFATDAEMAHELRSLLFKTAPQTKKSVTRIVGTGKIKAVYFQPGIPGIPYIIDDYARVPYFDPKKTNYGLDIDDIPISSKSDKDYFSNVCSVSGGAGSMRLSDPDTAKENRASDWIPNKYSVETGIGIENMFQTYFCWVFDPEWELPKEIPLSESHSTIIAKTNLDAHSDKGLLNKELKDEEFAKTSIGKKLLKYNRVYKVYTIKVQEGIGHMKYMSENDIRSLIVQKKVGKKANIDYSEVTNLRIQLNSFYAKNLNDILTTTTNNPYLLGFDNGNLIVNVSNFLPSNIENPISSTYNPTKTYQFSPLKNLLKTVVVYYRNNGTEGATLEFASAGSTSFPYSRVIDAFIFFYKDYVATGEKSFTYIDSLDHINRCVPLRPVGEDASKYFQAIYSTTTTRSNRGDISPVYSVSTEAVTKLTGYEAIPGSFLSYYTSLFGVAKIESKSRTTTYYSDLKNGSNTTVLEYKYAWYRNIFLKYIKPRYAKVKSCKNIVIRECVNNFVEDLIRYGIEGENGDKEAVVLLCDDVLFDPYTGFYILNETSLNETISSYVNTTIYPEYLSNDIESLNLRNEDGIVGVSNKDISRVVVSRQVMGKSTCAISIKNNKRKYNIDNDEPLYGGELVFEPMDEVLVFLPSTNMELLLSFKGLVSSVEENTNNGYHSVELACECPIKRLEMVRTNIKPSLSTKEAENNTIHPFTVPEKLYNSFDVWGTYMMCQGLTYLHSMLPTHDDYNWSKKVYTLGKNNSPKFYDPLLTYLWYKSSSNISDQKTASNALSELLNKYICSNIHFKGERLSKSIKCEGVWNVTNYYDPKAINKISVSEDKPYSVDYEIYAQRTDSYDNDKITIVAQILGTKQPAFMLGVSDIPLIFSDYQTNLSILLNTAEKYNFFFYSNRSGVVQFRPPQIDATELSMKKGIIDTDVVQKTQDFSYYVHPDFLSEQITATYNVSTSDERLITWMPLKGEQHLSGTTGDTISCVIQNKPLALKYGIKSQVETVISGIKSSDALYLYGSALMDRNNKSFRNAKATTLGFGDMDINRTVYSTTDNTLYLREGLILDYDAGNTFTATSSLNWGRKNLFKIPLKEKDGGIFKDVSSELSRVLPNITNDKLDLNRNPLKDISIDFDFQDVDLDAVLSKLTQLFNNNQITVAYYNQLKCLINYVKNNQYSGHLLSAFMFNGYVWDGVSSISFEDLMQVAYDSKLAAYADFETVITLTSNDVKEYKRLAEIRNKFKKESSTYLTNSTGEYVCTILSSGTGLYKSISVSQQPL